MRIKIENSGQGFRGQIITDQYDQLKEYALTQEPEAAQQRALRIFVNYLKFYKSKNISRYTGSYGLKHRVEELSKKLTKVIPGYQSEYIGNEDFIFAMLRNDFDCKNCDAERLGPNYFFNIKKMKHDWINDPLLQICVAQEFENEVKHTS
jgi:hypothetical protein